MPPNWTALTEAAFRGVYRRSGVRQRLRFRLALRIPDGPAGVHQRIDKLLPPVLG